MSIIDRFLDWILDTEGVSENWLLITPFMIIASLGFIFILIGSVIALGNYNIYLWLPFLSIGTLLYILDAVAVLNYECKQFGNYKWLRKKIF